MEALVNCTQFIYAMNESVTNDSIHVRVFAHWGSPLGGIDNQRDWQLKWLPTSSSIITHYKETC